MGAIGTLMLRSHDKQHLGVPGTFSFEQYMQITTLAYEQLMAVDRPMSAWTP